jgi:hypothetical protein
MNTRSTAIAEFSTNTGITRPDGAGAGTVNCQYGAGPWEKFRLLPA